MRKNCGVNLFAVVGATAMGTVIGVLVGLMFAPKSGNEFREDIVASGKNLVKKSKNIKDDFFDEVDEAIDEIGDFADTL